MALSQIETAYSGDHDFLNRLHEIIRLATSIILTKSFDLSAEKTIVLSASSDPAELCYKYYGKIDNDTLQYFFDSNNIVNDEFLELSEGREIKIYA